MNQSSKNVVEASQGMRTEDSDIFGAMSRNAPPYTPDVWNDLRVGAVVTYGEPCSILQLTSNCFTYAVNDQRCLRLRGLNPFDILDVMNPSAKDRAVAWHVRKDIPALFWEAGGWGRMQVRSNFLYAREVSQGLSVSGLIYVGRRPRKIKEHYLVAFYLSSSASMTGRDYHFVRQNLDSVRWSHKMGGMPVSEVDKAGKVITDPGVANMGEYMFVTFMAVPCGGIEPRVKCGNNQLAF